jgi:hypothetical protein
VCLLHLVIWKNKKQQKLRPTRSIVAVLEIWLKTFVIVVCWSYKTISYDHMISP